MGYLDRVMPEDVIDPDSYCRYVCQTVGSPWTMTDSFVMKKKLKTFFKAYPECGYGTLIRIAQWTRSKKKRPPHAYMVVDYARYAWADGALPELDPSNVDLELERKIGRALEIETDPEWRRKLVLSEGSGRRAVFQQWASQTSSTSH